MRRIALSLATVAVTAVLAAPAAAATGEGGGAYAAAGGAGTPESAGAGTTGGASFGALQQAEAERAAKRRALARKRQAAKRAAARKRARLLARKRAAARKQAKARAKARAKAKAKAKARTGGGASPAPAPVGTGHVFPVTGTSFSLGGPDSRFGAGRPGHVHQGQDVSAPLGTPLVAPTAGTVRFVKYQAEGAGYYIVMTGAGESYDYVFMHLRKGSILVEPGQAVARGQQIAQVGNTGRSSGPHLHFEIWEGGWYVKGGKPIDPLPFLQAWLR